MGYSIGQYMITPMKDRLPDQVVVFDHALLNKTFKYTHFLSMDFGGGLGNLMFEYAALYGVAKFNGMISVISEDTYISTVFPFMYAESTKELNPGRYFLKFRERQSNFDKRVFRLNFLRDIQLEGFYQSWKYFEHAKKDIKKQFQFSEDVEKEAQIFLWDAFRNSKFTDRQDLTFVGIHIRRGDFLEIANVERGYSVANVEYIKRAMSYFRKKYKNVIFVVCSDDKKWSRNNVKSQTDHVAYSFHGTASLDLCILSKCNHTIMTVGTFGWWAAWLAGGETVYYKGFPLKGSKLYYNFEKKDFYYPHWIAM